MIAHDRQKSSRERTPRSAKRSFRMGALCSVLSAAVSMTGAAAQSDLRGRTESIVGLGAATCRQFNDEIAANPQVRKDYLAWAQGFMSAIILSRPPGVDEGLDLIPPTFGLMAQLGFLEAHCARNQAADFSEAVEALYKRLRLEGKT